MRLPLPAVEPLCESAKSRSRPGPSLHERLSCLDAPNRMNKHRFWIGLFLSLLGLGIVIVALGMRPTNILDHQWRAKIAPVHLGWMIGSGICVVGLILILQDTFLGNLRIESLEEKERKLREEILTSLAQARMSQQELGELIGWKYGRTGLIGLSAKQMEEIQHLLKRRIENSRLPKEPPWKKKS